MFKGKFRWLIMSFISILMFINFIDRSVISLSTGPIMEEFGFTATNGELSLVPFSGA